MEIDELQKIWKESDRGIHQKSKDELNLLLTSITRNTINKFLYVMGAGILSGTGLLIFLTYTSLNRLDDPIYLLNNITLGIISLLSIISGLMSWYRIQDKEPNQSLKSWLEVRINHLSKLPKGKFNKLYVIILPIIYVLTILSIHVYFENKPFLDVLRTEESLIGLIIGTLIGLIVSFYAVRRIRTYELTNLKFLKDLYNRLCNEG
jgi:hypothetical protein